MQNDGSAVGFRARGGARDLLSQAQEHEQGAQGGTQGGVHEGVQGGALGGITRAATPLQQHIEQGAPPSELTVIASHTRCVILVTHRLQGLMVSISRCAVCRWQPSAAWCRASPAACCRCSPARFSIATSGAFAAGV